MNYVGLVSPPEQVMGLTNDDTLSFDMSQNSVFLENLELLRLCVSHLKQVKLTPIRV